MQHLWIAAAPFPAVGQSASLLQHTSPGMRKDRCLPPAKSARCCTARSTSTWGQVPRISTELVCNFSACRTCRKVSTRSRKMCGRKACCTEISIRELTNTPDLACERGSHPNLGFAGKGGQSRWDTDLAARHLRLRLRSGGAEMSARTRAEMPAHSPKSAHPRSRPTRHPNSTHTGTAYCNPGKLAQGRRRRSPAQRSPRLPEGVSLISVSLIVSSPHAHTHAHFCLGSGTWRISAHLFMYQEVGS